MGHTDLCKWGRLVVFPHPLRPSPLSVWCVQANDRRWAFESQLGCVAVSEAFLLSGPQYARLYNGMHWMISGISSSSWSQIR